MAPELRWDNQVVVVTGAGSGLGRQYAKFYAARGAAVIVNDLGGSINGDGSGSSKAADDVVAEIRAAGGRAAANYDSVEDGERIIETAIREFGRVDVLINNAGILRDITIKNMKDRDWDKIVSVHLTGAYKCTRAAIPYMRKQKYGRIINTSSSSGLFGNFGQSNYAAAKMALIGFTKTLAKEGQKYNIIANALAPGAASKLTATVFDQRMMEIMKPDWVVPLVGVLTHKSNTKETGSIFEASAGHFSKIRWERSGGLQLRPDETLTAEALLQNWSKISDFSKKEYPNTVKDPLACLEAGLKLPKNNAAQSISLKGKVALVTGGGEGLGRSYCRLFAKLGAKVAVCDIVGAETVANELRQSGADAFAIPISVEKGDEVVDAVIKKYGAIHILINNAGILADKAFANMSDDMWHSVINVHLRGTYKVIRAAWPYFLKQKYGRIVNTSSTSGLYGNFGQANYAAAKLGLVGFSTSLYREGQKYNIYVNTLCPNAGTNMTRTVQPEEVIQKMKPDFVAPLVALLSSDSCPTPTGRIYEAGCGWFAQTRWQRARGVEFDFDGGIPSVEAVFDKFDQICDFDNGLADNPESPADGTKYGNQNMAKSKHFASAKQSKL